MAARLIAAWIAGAGATTVAALAAALLSRRVRTADARLWHGVWSSIALASLVAPLAALMSPLWQIPVSIGSAWALATAAQSWSTRLDLVAGIAAGIAVAITAVLLSRLAWGCARALRLVRESAPLPTAESARADRLVPGVAGRCRLHPQLRVPVAIGWRHGVVLLPVSTAGWPDDRLRAILLHEQRHVLRQDFFWNVAAAAQCAFYWWNPVAWMVAARVRLTAELASDREAASCGAAAYAKHLIAASQELAHLSSPHRIVAPSAVSDLERRVNALLADGHAGAVSGWRLRVVMLAVAAAIVVTPMLVQARVVGHPSPGAHAAGHAEQHRH